MSVRGGWKHNDDAPQRVRLCCQCAAKSGSLILGRWSGAMRTCTGCQCPVDQGDVIQIPMAVKISKYERNKK